MTASQAEGDAEVLRALAGSCFTWDEAVRLLTEAGRCRRLKRSRFLRALAVLGGGPVRMSTYFTIPDPDVPQGTPRVVVHFAAEPAEPAELAPPPFPSGLVARAYETGAGVVTLVLVHRDRAIVRTGPASTLTIERDRWPEVTRDWRITTQPAPWAKP
jgi:hypothetical protein